MQNSSLDSPLRGLFRAFAKAFGTTLGLAFGITAFVLSFALFSTSGSEVPRKFTLEVQPDAKGLRTELGSSGPVILQLNIDGMIGMGQLSADATRMRLVESREDALKENRVKAILLNINSGGGLTTDSSAIYQMIKAYKEQYNVPVIAYADGLCASGAYQIALAADAIVTSDCSVIGSVGVLIFPPYFNLSEGLAKLGIKAQTVCSGKGKDTMNPFRPWQSEESADVQAITDYLYNHFVDMVIANRPQLTREKLIQEYGAQIYAPTRAKELGFIDETGYYLPQAIALAAKRAGLEGERYHVVTLTNSTWTSELFGGGNSSMLTKVLYYVATQLTSLRF